MIDWQVRRASPDDAAALSLIAGASFLETFAGILDGSDIVAHLARHSSPEAFARWLADGDSIVSLAFAVQRGAPIGYTVLTTPDLPVPTDAGDIELKRIYTLGRLHGSGMGPALMERAIADAQGAGYRRMLLGVLGQNHRAQRFYIKQGFDVVGTRQFMVGASRHDDLVFARAL